MSITIKCTVKKLYNNCPKASGWTGFFAHVQGRIRDIKVTGTPTFAIVEGMRIQIEAEQSADGTYKASSFKILTTTKSATLNYLTSSDFKGIGLKTAEAIYNVYGDDTLKKLAENLDEVANTVGLTPAQVATFRNAFNDTVAKVKQSVSTLTKNQINEILELLKNDKKNPTAQDVIDCVKENPYALIGRIKGYHFKDADEIALNICGFSMNDNRRVRYVLQKCINKMLDDSGDNYVNLSDDSSYNRLLKEFYDIIEPKSHDWDSATDVQLAQMAFGQILEDERRQKDPTVYLDNFSNAHYTNINHLYTMQGWEDQYCIQVAMQQLIATKASNFEQTRQTAKPNTSVNSIIANIDKSVYTQTKHHISDEQKNAIASALQHQVSILTGGPGRGKTETVNFICCAYEQICMTSQDIRINKNTSMLKETRKLLLCTPTGRAAKNITEHTGRQAFTIAKLIVEMRSSNADKIADNFRNGLAIIDECSMINQHDMAELLKILRRLRMQVLFVGDVNQLPPVSPGRPFKDFIESGKITIATLTVCFRTEMQAITDNADKILDGDTDIDYSSNFLLISPPTDKQCADNIISLYLAKLSAGISLRQLAILCPIRKGELGVNRFNARLQAALNPSNNNKTRKYDKNHMRYYYDDEGLDIPETYVKFSDTPGDWSRIRIGDRVMRLKNDYTIARCEYDKSFTLKYDESSGVFNGDCGTVVRYYPGTKTTPPQMVVTFDDGYTSWLDLDEENAKISAEMTLAYATTIHKSQGCEYDTVFMTMPSELQNPFLETFANRNLLYTGVTRTKNSFVCEGHVESWNKCILTESKPRLSTLAERI